MATSTWERASVPGALFGPEAPSSAMEWSDAEALVAALDIDAQRILLGILTSPFYIRADAIGRLHARDDGEDLAELLIELEDQEWARQWFIERLRLEQQT